MQLGNIYCQLCIIRGYYALISHLKNNFCEQRLLIVAKDPNNQYFPLAFIVIQIETKNLGNDFRNYFWLILMTL